MSSAAWVLLGALARWSSASAWSIDRMCRLISSRTAGWISSLCMQGNLGGGPHNVLPAVSKQPLVRWARRAPVEANFPGQPPSGHQFRLGFVMTSSGSVAGLRAVRNGVLINAILAAVKL